MAKKKQQNTLDPLFTEVLEHYTLGTQDNDTRRTRENGWNDVLKAYMGVLPRNWPYLAQVNIPIIRTTILEKNARLFNGRLRGQLTPREGADIIKAKVNNAILEYQWDQANEGGSMLEKWALMDKQARIFGASFAMVYWKSDGVFDGNEMKVWDNRDVFVDYTATHTKDSNWVQLREWKLLSDMENANEEGKEPVYKNLDILKASIIADKKSEIGYGDRRDVVYDSVIKQTLGLEDRVGADPSFPVVEIVTEYREDKWVTFAPRYGLILRDIPNPYDHGKIPVVMLRYYPNGDDVYGDSEVESVLPVSRAINALTCGAIDEVNLRMKPPVKVANNSTVRLDTLEYGPNALWLVGDRQDNVMEMQTGGEIVSNYQAMLSALLMTYNNAMGEMSQGVGVADPFNPDKTATEVRASERQKLTRDQNNQIYLEQALKDQMMLWLSNNQQFLFDDPENHYKVIRIVGADAIKELQRYGLDEMDTSREAMSAIIDMIKMTGGGMSNRILGATYDSLKTPKHPVILNPEAQSMDEMEIVPKLALDQEGEGAMLTVTPDDLEGLYDYVPSVQSMAINADESRKEGREKMLQVYLNPAVGQMLQLEGEKIKIKELLIQIAEDNGISNASKFFERTTRDDIQQPEQPGSGTIGTGVEPGIPNQAEGMARTPESVLGQRETAIPQPAG